MKIRILGAHNIESAKTGCTSFLIDDVLAVDAGALTRNLSFAPSAGSKPSCSPTTTTTISGISPPWV